MTAIVLRGDARSLPLADSSVDLIVTSPPYFGLRSYTDDGEHYDGQIGSEATPQEWLEQLLACTAEWSRVLKPTGSMFVNLGDKYAAAGGHTDRGERSTLGGRRAVRRSKDFESRTITGGLKQKSLMGLPWRYALGCIDQLELILRAEIIWSKPNAMPESVDDRVRRTHEQWFHFVTQRRYFTAVDEIREPHQRTWNAAPNGATYQRGDHYNTALNDGTALPHPLGTLPGSVWSIATEPLSIPADLGIDHFAAFPAAWPKRLINGWSPAAICTVCDCGLRPVSSTQQVPNGKTNSGRAKRQQISQPAHAFGFNGAGYPHTNRLTTIVGYQCACPTPGPTRPAVILDPFGGTGTTALVASALGRIGISVDLSHDYSRVAAWRTSDPAQIAKVLDLPKPRPETHGQRDLFDQADPVEIT